jgi:hypothetical protein
MDDVLKDSLGLIRPGWNLRVRYFGFTKSDYSESFFKSLHWLYDLSFEFDVDVFMQSTTSAGA